MDQEGVLIELGKGIWCMSVVKDTSTSWLKFWKCMSVKHERASLTWPKGLFLNDKNRI